MSFDEMDANSDGVIDFAEFQAGLYQVARKRVHNKLFSKSFEEAFPRLPVTQHWHRAVK